MGYSTDFYGRFDLDRPLSRAHESVLKKFAETRHEGNSLPKICPGIWCQWVPTEDGAGIEWDGAEKFYDYTEWLVYLIENFLKPWGYVLNGKMNWEGERRDDVGTIYVKDNKVEAVRGHRRIITPGPSWEKENVWKPD